MKHSVEEQEAGWNGVESQSGVIRRDPKGIPVRHWDDQRGGAQVRGASADDAPGAGGCSALTKSNGVGLSEIPATAPFSAEGLRDRVPRHRSFQISAKMGRSPPEYYRRSARPTGRRHSRCLGHGDTALRPRPGRAPSAGFSVAKTTSKALPLFDRCAMPTTLFGRTPLSLRPERLCKIRVLTGPRILATMRGAADHEPRGPG